MKEKSRMLIENFFNHFEQQDYAQAIDSFDKLNKDEKIQLLKQLYYQAREAKAPVAISVNYRKLHENQTFNDFYNAWMPPIEATRPFKIGNKIYFNHFETPIRVINAVNMQDPSEVVSIGLVWCNSEAEFDAGLQRVIDSEANQIRADSISDVAEQTSSKIYKVKTDTQLGN